MVQINRNYKIESDSLNVILSRREVSKKSPGNDRWRTVGYFSTCEGALKALVDMEMRGTGLQDFETVVNKIRELKELTTGLGVKNLPL